LGQHLKLIDQLLIENSAALVVREEPLTVGGRTERVPAYQHCARPFSLVEPQQEIGEPDDRAAATVADPPNRFRQGVVGAMGKGIAIDDKQRSIHRQILRDMR
jgi:hypothetical protein